MRTIPTICLLAVTLGLPTMANAQSDANIKGTIRRAPNALISLPAFRGPSNHESTSRTTSASATNWQYEDRAQEIDTFKKFQDEAPAETKQEAADDKVSEKQQTQSLMDRKLMRPLGDISLDLHEPDKKTPKDRSFQLFKPDVDDWSTLVSAGPMFYQWEAPNIHYRKLYFEDVAAERYGQVPCGWRGTYRATCHWGASLLSAPIKMQLDPYFDCDTPYGYCRPGDATPSIWQKHVYR